MRVVSFSDAKLSQAQSGDQPRALPPLMTIGDLLERLAQLPSWSTPMAMPDKIRAWTLAVVRIPDTPEAIAYATNALARMMLEVVTAAAFGSGGKPIIWHIRPEIDVWRGDVIEYRHDGPDVCPMTDQKCVRDWQHVNVKIYARFGVDDFASGTEIFLPKGTPAPVGYSVRREIAEDNAVIYVKD